MIQVPCYTHVQKLMFKTNVQTLWIRCLLYKDRLVCGHVLTCNVQWQGHLECQGGGSSHYVLDVWIRAKHLRMGSNGMAILYNETVSLSVPRHSVRWNFHFQKEMYRWGCIIQGLQKCLWKYVLQVVFWLLNFEEDSLYLINIPKTDLCLVDPVQIDRA